MALPKKWFDKRVLWTRQCKIQVNWGYTACGFCATLGILLITSSFFVNDESSPVEENLERNDLAQVVKFYSLIYHGKFWPKVNKNIWIAQMEFV